jgi:hypothetical protein
MITSPGDPYRHGELWVFSKSSEQESPLKDGIFKIMNGVTPMMIGTSNLNNTDGSHTSSVSGDVGSAAPDD